MALYELEGHEPVLAAIESALRQSNRNEVMRSANPVPDHEAMRKINMGAFSARKLIADRRGNVAIIFALSLLPILAGVGAAVDVTRALQVKARLASALDAAGLAAGKRIDASDEVIAETAEAFFKANYPEDALGVPGSLSVVITGTKVTLDASASVDTTIMNLFGFDEIDVAAHTEISRRVTGLEIALALDNTGSMSGTKLEDLKSASHTLINILFGEETTPEYLKMSIVPFAAGVKVKPWDGVSGFSNDWLDMTGASSIHTGPGGDFDFAPGQSIWTLYNNITNRSWLGCLMERPINGLTHLDEEDIPPTSSNPDTLFVPWFAPDEPNGSSPSYPNTYLSDGVSGSAAVKQRSTVKYPASGVAISSSVSSSRGPDYNCKTIQSIQPLTNNRGILEAKIDSMTANYLTHIPVGLVWGWRTLSPEAPYTEGLPYTDEDNIKALVLMTDGENTFSGNSTHNKSTFTAYGFLAKQRLGSGIDTASEGESELDAKTLRVCDKIKAKGVIVYTIAFQVSSTTTQNMLKNCATTPDNFFPSSDGDALNDAFRVIASELSSLRISK
ncbi:MAG TPA: pilus assembly protein TadG [Alphaproteobacteria bacterium]|nr:pilus assembly protein TadG [Alphaproteobacteria bacterium]